MKKLIPFASLLVSLICFSVFAYGAGFNPSTSDEVPTTIIFAVGSLVGLVVIIFILKKRKK